MKEIVLAIVFLFLISSVQALDHPSIKILSYEGDLIQAAGTTKTYQVTVTNDGDAIIDKVYLDIFFLPSTWYEIGKGVLMKPNDTFNLNYTLHPPSDASGILYFNLSAKAYRGFGIVDTKIVPITISIRSSGTAVTQTTTTQITTQTMTQTTQIMTETTTQATMETTTQATMETTTQATMETTTQTTSPLTTITITTPDLLKNPTFLAIILIVIVLIALFFLLRKS